MGRSRPMIAWTVLATLATAGQVRAQPDILTGFPRGQAPDILSGPQGPAPGPDYIPPGQSGADMPPQYQEMPPYYPGYDPQALPPMERDHPRRERGLPGPRRPVPDRTIAPGNPWGNTLR